MKMFVPPRLTKALKRGMWRFLVMRQSVVNRMLSGLYGVPMQVLPAGHVGLAGAMVLWTVQDGGRQIIMVRNGKSRDTRARLVSFMGLGKHSDMAIAMKDAARVQLGDLFTKTLKWDKVSLDRVAAAPMFTYTDDENGIVTPVQVLVWVQQVLPVQLELIKMTEGNELVLVNEVALMNGKVTAVSPTHIAMWKAVARHLPQKQLPREEDSDAREERLAETEVPARRVVH